VRIMCVTFCRMTFRVASRSEILHIWIVKLYLLLATISNNYYLFAINISQQFVEFHYCFTNNADFAGVYFFNDPQYSQWCEFNLKTPKMCKSRMYFKHVNHLLKSCLLICTLQDLRIISLCLPPSGYKKISL